MTIADLPTDALMYITDRPSVVFTRGEGAWLWDQAGRKYLDFMQGWAVNCLGHCPKEITESISKQAALLISPSPAFYNEPSIRLAARIVGASDFDHVFFANSGAEANEGAFKLARRWGSKFKDGAFEFITFTNSFHGRTIAMMSASGKAQFKPLFEPKVPGFTHVPLNDIAAVEKAIGPKTVAVMIEPVQGEAGVIPATDEFMRELRALTTKHKVLLIVDEVQTGMSRTGKLWGYQHSGIKPDMMTLGKGIGGGVPLSALVATDAVSCFQPGDQGGTYNGNPLMTAVGSAIFDTVSTPAFLNGVSDMGDYLSAGLRRLSSALGLGEVRGRGLLIALELGEDIGAKIVDDARTNGLLLNSPRAATLRFMPALNVSRDEVDQMLAMLDASIRRVRAAKA